MPVVRRSPPEATNVPATRERGTRATPGAFLGKPFGVLLSEALKRHGLTKGEAARRLGVDRGRITDWTNGRREPGAERGLWILLTLGLDLDDFRP